MSSSYNFSPSFTKKIIPKLGDPLLDLPLTINKAMSPILLDEASNNEFLYLSASFPFIIKEKEFNSNVVIISAVSENSGYNHEVSSIIINKVSNVSNNWNIIIFKNYFCIV